MSYVNVYHLRLVAADYRNEQEVGDALQEAFRTGIVKREDLFITTKVSFISDCNFSQSHLLWLTNAYSVLSNWIFFFFFVLSDCSP